MLEIVESPGYGTSSRLVTDSNGAVTGQVVTWPDGAEVFIDAEGNSPPRSDPR